MMQRRWGRVGIGAASARRDCRCGQMRRQTLLHGSRIPVITVAAIGCFVEFAGLQRAWDQLLQKSCCRNPCTSPHVGMGNLRCRFEFLVAVQGPRLRPSAAKIVAYTRVCSHIARGSAPHACTSAIFTRHLIEEFLPKASQHSRRMLVLAPAHSLEANSPTLLESCSYSNEKNPVSRDVTITSRAPLERATVLCAAPSGAVANCLAEGASVVLNVGVPREKELLPAPPADRSHGL
jgi:hypothetical protein